MLIALQQQKCTGILFLLPKPKAMCATFEPLSRISLIIGSVECVVFVRNMNR